MAKKLSTVGNTDFLTELHKSASLIKVINKNTKQFFLRWMNQWMLLTISKLIFIHCIARLSTTTYLLTNIDLVSRDGRLDATLLKKSKVHFITAITSSKGNISHGNLRDILWFQDVEWSNSIAQCIDMHWYEHIKKDSIY